MSQSKASVKFAMHTTDRTGLHLAWARKGRKGGKGMLECSCRIRAGSGSDDQIGPQLTNLL